MHCQLIAYVRIVVTTLIILTCLLGDNFVELTQHPLLKALADNATHAVVGALTGIIYIMHFYERTTNIVGWMLIFVCFAISSLIDVDHFIEARSWNLENATNLSRRPFMHCSTIILVLLAVYLHACCFNSHRLSLAMGIILCAFITHHTRDAVRRGYWLYPFGHTERVPYVLYILGTICTPYLLYYLHNLCRSAWVQNFLVYRSTGGSGGSGNYRLLDV